MRYFLQLVFCLFIILVTAHAGVPELMNYQGFLTDSGGEPITDTLPVVFQIYDDSTGGVSIWSESHSAVQISGGQFNVLLGSVSGLGGDTVFSNSERWLEMTIDGDPPISPRVRLTTSPYAFKAEAVSYFSPGPDNSATGENTFVAGDSNTVDGDHSSISGGLGNTVLSGTSVIAGGHENEIDVYNHGDTLFDTTGAWAFNSGAGFAPDNKHLGFLAGILAGFGNHAHGTATAIGGGFRNTAMCPFSGIMAGAYNNTNSYLSFIGAGYGNTIGNICDCGWYSGIVAGFNNKIEGYYSFIGGGLSNHIQNCDSFMTIGGGRGNRTYHDYTTIGGGRNNSAYNYFAVVAGGTDNFAGSIGSSISGGGNNIISSSSGTGIYSTIGGGMYNTTEGEYATISGGGWATYGDPSTGNSVYADYGSIGGGGSNKVGSSGISHFHTYGTIAGGESNLLQGSYSFIGGGYKNITYDIFNTIGGGDSNYVDAPYGTIGGGEHNGIRDEWGFIGGGQYNVIEPGGYHGCIVAGDSNFVSSSYGSIGGGWLNSIESAFGTIGGGTFNHIHGSAEFSTISGGDTNSVFNKYGTIGGGDYNEIEGDWSTIGGGSNNLVKSGSHYGTIGGGVANEIQSASIFATIGGGYADTASGNYATIAGGYANTATDLYTTVGGGHANKATGNSATIAGGDQNRVSGLYSTIPGGTLNSVTGNWSMAAGVQATASHNGSFIWNNTGSGAWGTANDQTFIIQATNGVGMMINDPNSNLHVDGSFAVGYEEATSNYIAGFRDCVIAASSSVTVTLPDPVGLEGRLYTVKNIAGVGSIVTVDTQSGFIDGSINVTLTQYQYVTVVSNNADWLIIGN